MRKMPVLGNFSVIYKKYPLNYFSNMASLLLFSSLAVVALTYGVLSLCDPFICTEGNNMHVSSGETGCPGKSIRNNRAISSPRK